MRTKQVTIKSIAKMLNILVSTVSRALHDAFFAVSDRKAVGAILALRQYGFKIPQHIGVVGFTNAPVSEVIIPPMTTIEQPTYEIGAKSYQLLLDQIKNPDMEPQQIVMNGRLIIRASSMKSTA